MAKIKYLLVAFLAIVAPATAKGEKNLVCRKCTIDSAIHIIMRQIRSDTIIVFSQQASGMSYLQHPFAIIYALKNGIPEVHKCIFYATPSADVYILRHELFQVNSVLIRIYDIYYHDIDMCLRGGIDLFEEKVHTDSGVATIKFPTDGIYFAIFIKHGAKSIENDFCCGLSMNRIYDVNKQFWMFLSEISNLRVLVNDN